MQEEKMTYLHLTARNVNPQDTIFVHVAGVGGNGTQLLTDLARLDLMMRRIGGGGLIVKAYDADNVEEPNCGRQLFSKSEIGMNKAVAFIERVNKFFGLSWSACPHHFTAETCRQELNFDSPASIVITCVDTGKARVKIGAALKEALCALYWLDLGNTQFTGQAVLGTTGDAGRPQPRPTYASMLSMEMLLRSPNISLVQTLPTVLDLYPDIEEQDNEADQGPSCSMQEALDRQSMYINKVLAGTAMKLLTDLIMSTVLTEHGMIVNLKDYIMAPLKINPGAWKQLGYDAHVKARRDGIPKEGPAEGQPNATTSALPSLNPEGKIDNIGQYTDNQLFAYAEQIDPSDKHSNDDRFFRTTQSRFIFALLKLMQHLDTSGSQPGMLDLVASRERLAILVAAATPEVQKAFAAFMSMSLETSASQMAYTADLVEGIIPQPAQPTKNDNRSTPPAGVSDHLTN